MCDICNMSHCPPGCPSYEGTLGGFGRAVGRCILCEETVHGGERVLEKNGKVLCEGCVEAAVLDDILAVEGVCSARALLCERLGWRPRVY